MEHHLHDDPRIPTAWGPWFAHEYINYYVVNSISRLQDLPPVRVKTNPGPDPGLWPIGPNHVDLYKESYRDLGRLDPFQAFDYHRRNGDYSPTPPLDQAVEPWKILVIYSTEPDLNPDCGLFLHKLQKLTGGSHGWRHMRLRAGRFTLGSAPYSVTIHDRLAGCAFQEENDYWGWRYLSRCSHYLADLGHPFHVKAAPHLFLIKGLFSFRKMFKIISAFHQGYEVYCERRFRQGYEPFGRALADGVQKSFVIRDYKLEMDSYIKRTEKRLTPIFNFFMDQFGRELIDVFDRMDEYRHLDAVTQTMMCSAEADRVIFEAKHPAALEFLDRITVEILFDVGQMLGALFSAFAERKQ